MKICALLALCCMCTLVSAQEDVSESISFYISPTLAHRILSEKNLPDEIADVYYETETPKLGFSVGALANFRVHHKIIIQTGFCITNNGYLKKKDFGYENWEYQIDLIPGERVVYQYYYFDIPVRVKYTVWENEKSRFYTIAGAEGNLNLINTGDFWGLPEDAKFRGYNVSLVTGAGFAYVLGQRLEFFAEPTYRQMLLSMEKPARRRLYSVGLATGLTFIYNKKT